MMVHGIFGDINGVAKRFTNDNPVVISEHCLAHCINLCLQEVSRSSKSIKEDLNFAMDIIQLMKYSSKHQAVFEALQEQQESPFSSGIRTLCPTCWTVLTGAMEAIINNYDTLQATVEAASHGTDEYSRQANSVPALMDCLQPILVSNFYFFAWNY